MNALERLLLEAIPVRPAPAQKPAAEPWTPEEQAQHRAELDAAVAGWRYGREQRRDGRHLWLVDTDDKAA